jgi:hypothetical protein
MQNKKNAGRIKKVETRKTKNTKKGCFEITDQMLTRLYQKNPILIVRVCAIIDSEPTPCGNQIRKSGTFTSPYPA